MNRKKVLAVLLVSVLVLGLTACGKKDNGAEEVKNGTEDMVQGVENGAKDLVDGNKNTASTGSSDTVTMDGLTAKLHTGMGDITGYDKLHELGKKAGAYTVVLSADKDMKNFSVFTGVEGVLDMTNASAQKDSVVKGEAVVLRLDKDEKVLVSCEVDGTVRGYNVAVVGDKLDIRTAAEGWQNGGKVTGDGASTTGMIAK